MREIKFKFWNPINKVMEIPKVDIQALMEGRRFTREEILKFVPLQYTGRKDKNGKEIYEGDIDFSDGEYTIVKWSEEGVGFGLELENGDIDVCICFERLNIVGNIYETPDLVDITEN